MVINIIRKWWRPVTCIWLSLTLLVNGVIIPFANYLQHGVAETDLMNLGALVTATAGAFAV